MLSITDYETWDYLATAKLSAVLRDVTCQAALPADKKLLLKYHLGEKSIKLPFVVYTDFETILGITRSCETNPENLYTAKINKHTASVFLFW